MEYPKRNRAVLSKKSFKFQRSDKEGRRHCCVPLCSASSKFNGVLSFHRFPKEPQLRAQWLAKIRRDGFVVKPTTVVCSCHFESEQFFSLPTGQRRLLKNSVPTLFQWNNYTVKKRPGIWERRCRSETTADGEEVGDCAAATVCPLDVSVDSEPEQES